VPILGIVPYRPALATPDEAADALAAGLDLDGLMARL
jgi:hypothetical protein